MELLIDDHLKFSDEHKRLLTAQIVLTDRMDKLAGTMDKLTGTVQELAEAQRHTDERLNALISVVDGLIRKPPASLEGSSRDRHEVVDS